MTLIRPSGQLHDPIDPPALRFAGTAQNSGAAWCWSVYSPALAMAAGSLEQVGDEGR
jgi:hypothetical protein